MESATAQLNAYRQSPRKVRLVANLIKGKRAAEAVTILRFADKRAAGPMIKLVKSAIANAKNRGMDTDSLIVDKIAVNAGQILYRHMPMSRGRAFSIRKRTSRVSILLSETVKNDAKDAKAAPAKTAKKSGNKTAKK